MERENRESAMEVESSGVKMIPHMHIVTRFRTRGVTTPHPPRLCGVHRKKCTFTVTREKRVTCCLIIDYSKPGYKLHWL